MLLELRQHIILKCLWGFLALHFLNVSIDVPDRNPEYVAENLSINDQESIIELVVEKFFGFENAFAEYDDTDQEDHTKKSTIQLEWISSSFFSFSFADLQTLESPLLSRYHKFLLDGYSNPISPPPKA